MKKSMVLTSTLLTSMFAMADYYSVIISTPSVSFVTGNEASTPITDPDTTIRCAAGEGVTRAELIAMVDNGDPVSEVCTSNITDFSEIFNYYRVGANAAAIALFNEDISNWDVSNGTTFRYMFNLASTFNQDISSWDVSSARNFDYMFIKASSFNKDISGWDVSNVNRFTYMFYNATNFNQSLDNWDVSNGTDFRYMFYGAKAFNKEIGSWDVSNSVSFYAMFEGASSFNKDVHLWDVENATSWGKFNLNSPLELENIPFKFGGLDQDTDSDGVSDHTEVYNDTDPLDPASK